MKFSAFTKISATCIEDKCEERQGNCERLFDAPAPCPQQKFYCPSKTAGRGLTPNFRSTPPPLKHIRQGSPIHRLSFVHYDSVKYVVSSQNEPTFLFIFRVKILDHLLTCASLPTEIRRGSICFAAKSQKLFPTLASEFS